VRQQPVLRGLDGLKRRVAGLPKGYLLCWKDERELDRRYDKPNDRQRFAVPPAAVTADVKQFAEAHHVEMVGPDPPERVPHN
jgi:hypothetical protein